MTLADLARRREAAPTREELREHLVRTRIAGRVATPRENNLQNYRLMSERNPRYTFGLQFDGRWAPEDVLALMAERCGVSPDPDHVEGVDTIDPDRTLDRLDALADRVRLAAQRHERVIIATGHPTGLFPVHLAITQLLTTAGCPVLTPAAGWSYHTQTRHGRAYRELRFVQSVAMLHSGAELKHTHSPKPMEAMLAALASAGQAPPGLVVADHGWAGAAGQAGVDAVGYADCNDPALFVGEAEGKIAVAVPLDDNVTPHLYEPMIAYLVRRVGL